MGVRRGLLVSVLLFSVIFGQAVYADDPEIEINRRSSLLKRELAEVGQSLDDALLIVYERFNSEEREGNISTANCLDYLDILYRLTVDDDLDITVDAEVLYNSLYRNGMLNRELINAYIIIMIENDNFLRLSSVFESDYYTRLLSNSDVRHYLLYLLQQYNPEDIRANRKALRTAYAIINLGESRGFRGGSERYSRMRSLVIEEMGRQEDRIDMFLGLVFRFIKYKSLSCEIYEAVARKAKSYFELAQARGRASERTYMLFMRVLHAASANSIGAAYSASTTLASSEALYSLTSAAASDLYVQAKNAGMLSAKFIDFYTRTMVAAGLFWNLEDVFCDNSVSNIMDDNTIFRCFELIFEDEELDANSFSDSEARMANRIVELAAERGYNIDRYADTVYQFLDAVQPESRAALRRVPDTIGIVHSNPYDPYNFVLESDIGAVRIIPRNFDFSP